MNARQGSQRVQRRPGVARRAALGAAGAAAAAAGIWVLADGGGPHERRFALSPQECNTECQSRQTDCIDDCDGNLACEGRCTEAGLRCVARCGGHGPDAGTGGGANGNGGRAGNGGRSGSGGRSGTGGTGGRAGPR
jgi:hypothetical protein